MKGLNKARVLSRRSFLGAVAMGVGAMGTGLVGCGGGAAQSGSGATQSGGKSVTLAVSTAPITLDPLAALDQVSMTFVSQALECLFDKDDKGTLKPAACESYTVSDDQLTWTFKLRDA